MKEIIYIQAGSFANYVGAHFWNTQECYLVDDKDVDPLISFTERQSDKGQSSYYPRVLLFDKRDRFGTLSRANALSGTNQDESLLEDSPGLWTGSTTEYKQERIPKSAYHNEIDDENLSDDESHELKGATTDTDRKIRYWSDFTRVYYTPRSVQPLPDILGVEAQVGEWEAGQRTFLHYDKENELMEGTFRHFFEECDSPQGLQILNDTSYFGGYMHSFLTAFRDDHAKLPCLVFPLISDAVPGHMASSNPQSTEKIVNDALYLRSLNELASMAVPILPSRTWPANAWGGNLLPIKRDSMYHTSAVLSSHIETATFPLRSSKSAEDFRSLYSRLNWRGSVPFAELSGIFPVDSAIEDTRISRFSTLAQEESSMEHIEYALVGVTRGLSPGLLTDYCTWISSRSNQTMSYSVHAPLCPVPTSFPRFFKSTSTPSSTGDPLLGSGLLNRPTETSVFSALSSSTRISQNFSAYATTIEGFLKRNTNVQNMDLNADDLRDLVSDLWTMHDSAGGEVSTSSAADE